MDFVSGLTRIDLECAAPPTEGDGERGRTQKVSEFVRDESSSIEKRRSGGGLTRTISLERRFLRLMRVDRTNGLTAERVLSASKHGGGGLGIGRMRMVMPVSWYVTVFLDKEAIMRI